MIHLLDLCARGRRLAGGADAGEHGELDEVPTPLVTDFLAAIREQIRAGRELGSTAYIQFVRNAAAQAGSPRRTTSFRRSELNVESSQTAVSFDFRRNHR